MNRRSFFKMVTGFAVGVVAAFMPSKTKAKSIEYVKVAECKNKDFTEPKWPCKKEHIMDFEEPIEGVENWHGRFFVYCKHSVWEMFEDYEGELKRKLIRYI